MKKYIMLTVAGLALGIGYAFAAPVHDWKDLDKVHNHVKQAIEEMNKARAANHYDMAGHGAKAEAALHDAERELAEAVQAAKQAR